MPKKPAHVDTPSFRHSRIFRSCLPAGFCCFSLWTVGQRMKLRVLVCICLLVAVAAAQGEEGEGEGEEKPSTGPKQPEFMEPSYPMGDVYFVETFTDAEKVWKRWVKSTVKKDGSPKYTGEWVLEAPGWEGAREGDQGLVIKEAAKHYAISAALERPFSFEGKDAFVIQYDINFQEGLTCGGAYVKLLLDTPDLESFNDKTPYSIMFGPDKCGMSSKVHVIIQFKNPITGEIEEKHSKQSTESMDFFNDKKTHLFTLLIRSDGVYHVVIDQIPFLKGNLLEDLTPPIIPSEEIDDSTDKMPADWDEREKIPDPNAEKPEDWDEDAPQKIPDSSAVKPDGWLDEGPEYIADPEAEVPEDWDEEEDGEWEAPLTPNPACEEVGCGEWKPPMIQNPNYKGKWKPSLIVNPDYMGIWKPERIANPTYFEDDHPFDSLLTITAVGFELWTMSGNIHFDNILICTELAVANNFAREGWTLKFESERVVGGAMSMGPWLDWFIDTANEYPYLWALYAVAIVSPFVLCAAFCVRSKPKPKEDEAAKRKKTDEPSPDDPQPKEEEPKEEEPKEEEPKEEEPKEGEPSEGGEEKEKDPSPKPGEDTFIGEDEPEAEPGSSRKTQEEEGDPSQGEASQGEASQGEASQGEASQGEASQGEASQGEASQGEGSQGEPEVEEDPGETAAATTTAKKSTKKGGARKRKQARRED